MSWLAGAAVAAALLAARGPGGRSVHAVVGGARTGSGGSPASASDRVAPPAAPGRRLGLLAHARGRRPPDDDLALLVTDVASRLRAGADPAAAWREALGRPVPHAGPDVGDLSRSPASRSRAAAVVVACRLAASLGTPLAPLLDGVAEQLAAEAEADGERRAALAGPRATAQVLTWLPVLGVVLGIGVGADPLAVLLDGSLGSAALVAGVALVLVGRAWTGRLARRAAAAGRGS